MAARQATRRIRQPQMQQLIESHERCIVAAESGDHDSFINANKIFHETIIVSSRNRILIEQIRSVGTLTAVYRRYITHQSGRMLTSVREHQSILDAIGQHVSLLGEGLSDLLRDLADDDVSEKKMQPNYTPFF